uniref:Uncharacterized protein n=1 Tax=Electrophorus electricus TaxID=8005 RepID=A0AAY5EQM5_ELEEL
SFTMSAHQHLHIVGIHVQFLGVQDTQFSVGGLDVVHVLHGSLQTAQYNCSVGGNTGVSHDGSGIVQVSKFGEIPLGPGVHDKTSEWLLNIILRRNPVNAESWPPAYICALHPSARMD